MNNIYYYNVSRTPSTGSVDIKLWYDQSDQNVGEADIVIGHWCDATCGTSNWNNWGKNNITPGVNWNWDATNNWVQVLGAGTFSPIGPGRKAWPLPIDLLNFSGECEDGNAVLQWVTATELNNEFFTLERSCDGINYEIINTVKGAGNSTSMQTYTYIDVNFPEGTCYYRLKQTDFDGNYKYFNNIPVRCSAKEGNYNFEIVSVIPNPTRDFAYLFFNSTDESEITIVTVDILGRQIATNKFFAHKGLNNSTIDLSEFSNGVYFIRLSNGEKQFIEKIMKRF